MEFFKKCHCAQFVWLLPHENDKAISGFIFKSNLI